MYILVLLFRFLNYTINLQRNFNSSTEQAYLLSKNIANITTTKKKRGYIHYSLKLYV